MKKVTQTALKALFAALLLQGGISCSGEGGTQEPGQKDSTEQIPSTTHSYSQPAILDYGQELDALKEAFYPIGWSPSGQLAYYHEPFPGETGMYLAQLCLFDPATSGTQVLWELGTDAEMPFDEGGIKTLWEKEGQAFADLLGQREVVPTQAFQMLGKEFSYEGKDYTLSVETATKEHPYDGYRVVSQASFIVRNKEMGAQQVEDKLPEDEIFMLDAHVFGVLLQPSSSKGIMLCAYERTGIGGPPNYLKIKIVPINLSQGFNAM